MTLMLKHFIGTARQLALVLANFCLIAFLSVFFTAHALAQQESIAAKMAPIISFILNAGDLPAIPRPQANSSLALDLQERADDAIDLSTNDSLLVEFDRQPTNVELCFDINTPRNGLQFELNGEVLNRVLNIENCIVIPASQQRSINYLLIRTTSSSARFSRFELSSTTPVDLLGFPTVTRGQWDNEAVRKVLKIFAYGGQATDNQIQIWANLRPGAAIREMLNFDEFNAKLSPQVPSEPYDDIISVSGAGTYRGLTNYLASDASALPFPTAGRARENFIDLPSPGIFPRRFDQVIGKLASIRGLNPFRQKIGLWETNYHMVANMDAGVNESQIIRYYDDIMKEHAKPNVPYYKIMGVAAKSAAIAMQYGHRLNQWIENNATCRCNDDFAREIHQLFFGILGESDPNHEEITIPETAKMLTDMAVPTFTFTRPVDGQQSNAFADEITFGTARHHLQDVQIFGLSISGANAAEKIDTLMPISIEHPDSLENLPIIIVEGLADDNLNNSQKRILRQVWRDLGVNRNFLTFVRGYATSRLFHSASQFKHATTLDRAIYFANRYNTSNIEAYYGGTRFFNQDFGTAPTNVEEIGIPIVNIIQSERAGDVFRPVNNVFGAQSSEQAANSSLVFTRNYNRSANTSLGDFINNFANRCTDCDFGAGWVKDWTKVMPRDANGEYPVEYVARWLWRHAVGSMQGYTEVEEAHLSSFLGAVSLVEEDSGGENPTNSFFQTPLVWDLNQVLCVRADRIALNEPAANLSDIIESANTDIRCLADSNQAYSPAEQAELDLAINSDNLQNIVYLRQLVNELKAKRMPLEPSGTVEARRANARINVAMSFIFATPYVFATGGQ